MPPAASVCPTCKSSFTGGEQFCPRDGTPLRAELPDDPLAGRVLSGRYRLIEVIGRGGMGAVYRAHHILMDKPVAVKVLRHELASDTQAVARFHREARSASRLDHEHIIRVTDFGQTDDGLLFLVMELLDGENLAQVLRRGPLPWRRAATIMRDIALGLAHAHEQGVIHRDLKPENVVLVRRSRARQLIKVLDFGLAKLMHRPGAASGQAGGDERAPEPVPEDDPARQSLTRTGVVFGTPEYMSPEQAEGRSPSPQTDLYALGVVCFQMVTGQTPFVAPTFLLLIAKTVSEPPPRPSRLNPDAELPEELESLILRCLAKSPDDRPGSAEELADELDLLLARYPDEALRTGEVMPNATPPTGQPARLREPPPAAVAKTVRGPAAAASPPAQSPIGPTGPAGPKEPVAAAPAVPPGGVAKTVARNLAPGQVPYGASPPSAVASAFAALGDKPRPGDTVRSGSRGESAQRSGANATSALPRPAAARDDESAGVAARAASHAAPDPSAHPVSAPGEPADSTGSPEATGRSDSDPDSAAAASLISAERPPRAETDRALSPPERDRPLRELEREPASEPAASSESGDDEALSVPRRPYWAVALLGVVACVVGLVLAAPRLLRKPPPPPPPGAEELRKARELLTPERINAPGAVDEAMRLLLIERQREGTLRNTPELQRLLSLAYEAQQNRLRALGHMYLAVRLGGDGIEGQRSQLALSQLLLRMGHEAEACQTVRDLLHGHGKATALEEVRVPAQALVATLKCQSP
ncbi:MAG: protein kinase [Polyangia bacterium]